MSQDSKHLREEIDETLRCLWRTSGFLSSLAQDIQPLAPNRAEVIRGFIASIEEQARQLSPYAKLEQK